MATVRQYWNALRTTRNSLALRLGVDIPGTPKEFRAISGADLAAVAIVIKVLTDKGVATDADFQAAQQAALADVWDDEPNLP